MLPSRAIVVLGMHRSGTSALTRGLQSLGVFLGDDFLGARPDNPTGYWEDREIVALNERVFAALGLNWQTISLIDQAQWKRGEIQALKMQAVTVLKTKFLKHRPWGFKDPRTFRLLPFWQSVFHCLELEVKYVIAIRHPLSVVASLLKRQNIPPAISHLLTLVYIVPYLQELRNETFVVADYDLVLGDPTRQLIRLARALQMPPSQLEIDAIKRFSGQFLDSDLRHSCFSPDDFDAIPFVSSLAREVYLRLYELAIDQDAAGSADFWAPWPRIASDLKTLILKDVLTERTRAGSFLAFSNVSTRETEWGVTARNFARLSSSEFEGEDQNRKRTFQFGQQVLFPETRLFVVIGNQRTGTNLLREILNTNEQIGMLGEILSPSPAPAHWDNFLRRTPSEKFPLIDPGETEVLLDRYFQFVFYRIRNHWAGGDKSRCTAIGIDIKYNQLRQLAPLSWSSTAPPFLLSYLKARGATLIHVTRANVIQCAVSAMIAAERNFWHNYEGVVIDRSYTINPEKCLDYARMIARERQAFSQDVLECQLVECRYEDLIAEVAAAEPGGVIPERPGPLKNIASALAIPFGFRYDGRLRKAINIPYSKLLLNHQALLAAVAQSEFSALAPTLQNSE